MLDSFNQRSLDFLVWLKRLPGTTISSKIALEDLRYRNAGRGVIAVENIAEGEDLFTIPRSSILCLENADLPARLPHVFEDLDQWTAMNIVLIDEYLKGKKSFWKPYYDVLPQAFDTLIFWTKEELDELQASAVREKIGRASADEVFKSSIIPIWKDHATVFEIENGTGSLTDVEVLALAHRMASTIMAYAFDLEKDDSQLRADEDGYATEDDDENVPKGMIPLADMLNANAASNARLFYSERSVTMKAVQSIARGEEVLNDYGPLPRSDLLRRYGYTTPKYAPYDVVEISQDLVVECARKLRSLDESALAARVEYLDSVGALEDAYLLGRVSEDEANSALPDDLDMLLGVLLAPEDEYKRLQRRSDNWRNALGTDVRTVAIDVLETRMRQYATNIAEDRTLLNDSHVQGRRRYAIDVRLAEKEILEDTRQKLRGFADLLGDAEDQPQAKRRKT